MAAGRAAWVLVALSVAAGLFVAAAPSVTAQTRFTSCDSMHRVYKYGISKDTAAQTRAVRAGMYRPPVKATVSEDSYKTLDRDHDGTMCAVPK